MEDAVKKQLIRTMIGTAYGTAAMAALFVSALPSFVRLPLLLALLFWLSLGVGRWMAREAGAAEQCALGLTAVISWLAIFLSLFFYADRISPLAIMISLLPVILIACSAAPTKKVHRQTTGKHSTWGRFLTAGVIVGDTILLLTYFAARTDQPIRTPWDVIPWPTLLLFGSTTLMLVLLSWKKNAAGKRTLLALHLFVAYSMSEIVFALGFGFDPFIHRTAEAYVAQHGTITPKQPYYAGHYVIVTALNWMTGLTVDVIDRWLVPLLGPLTLPWIIPFGLRKFWGLQRYRAHLLTPLILLLPMMPLTFTVPNSLTVLFLFWTVFLLPAVKKRSVLSLLIILYAVASMMVHPLIGSVILGLTVAQLLLNKINHTGISIAIVVLNAVALPAMFALHNYRTGGLPFNTANPLSLLDHFTGLFTNPYIGSPKIPFAMWDILYGYRLIMPAIFITVIIIGLLLNRTQQYWQRSKPYLLVALGLVLAIFLLSTSMTIPNIISNEQLEFSLRLKQTLGILLLPLFLIGINKIIGAKENDGTTPFAASIAVALSLLMVVSWYLTYPQANIRAVRTGWSVGRADFEAVGIIESAAKDEPYIALSNQMLSVAALRTTGFKNFSYALPTGGKLYEYYLVLSYYNRSRDVVLDAMNQFGSERAFYAIHDYDPDYELITSALSQIADENWSTADGTISIFSFEKDD